MGLGAIAAPALAVEMLERPDGGRAAVDIAIDTAIDTVIDRPADSLPLAALDDIRTNGIFRVSVARRAVPLSYRYPDGRLDGYCLDLVAEIVEAITTQLDLRRPPLVEIVTSDLGTRFDLVRDGVVHLECGPNTIREVEGVAFSAPFLVTGMQFISERESRLERRLSGTDLGQVGVLRDSATSEFMGDRYADTTLELFAGDEAVKRGIEALQGRLDAFATDGLLTIGELAIAGRSLSDYRIYPENPLLCSPYGLLLPADEPEWQAIVDGVINSEAGARLWAEWFGAIDAYLEPAEQFCGVEVVPARATRQP